MLRKIKIIIKILIVHLFQSIFNDSPFSLRFLVFLATAWTNIPFYHFDLYQVQFETSKTNSFMFPWHILIMLEN